MVTLAIIATVHRSVESDPRSAMSSEHPTEKLVSPVVSTGCSVSQPFCCYLEDSPYLLGRPTVCYAMRCVCVWQYC